MSANPDSIDPSPKSSPTYFGEFLKYRRFLAAATLGAAAGYSLVNYIGNIFMPHLLEDLGWTRSQLALVQSINFVNILTLPIIGRLTDAYGVKRIALVGVTIAPLVWLGLSVMTGALWVFFLLTFFQLIVVGGTTNPMVYGRLIAMTFRRARGVALAIAASAAPVAGAISVPFLSSYIDANGWRAGYVVVAIGTAIVGFTAVALIPRNEVRGTQQIGSPGQTATKSYRKIFKLPAFQLILAGVILCNLSFNLQTAHLKILMLDNGMDSSTASLAISLFATSVMVGRLLCGIALDRLPTWLVTAFAMGVPGIGLALLASGASTLEAVAPAVVLLGFSLGAEGDIFSYVVRKYFDIHIFSTVLGLVLSGMALAVTSGSLLLSLLLKLTGSYTPFMVFASICALVGALMFALLRRIPHAEGA